MQVLRWPASAEMIVPREAIKRHPRTVYEVVMASGILNSTHHHNSAHENCGVPAQQVREVIGPHVAPRDPMDACASSLNYAHGFERAWFYIWHP